MKRTMLSLFLIALLAVVLIGCGGGEEETAEAPESEEMADATSRPTQLTAGDYESLQEAVGPDGSWIIIFNDDLTLSEGVEISGEVYEEEGADAPRRKLALYAQDADRNVTDRYTLTLPRLVVSHANTRIQSGQVSGEVFVRAEGFELTRGGTINGNLYFETEALRDSATIDDTSTVIGETRIGYVDAVSRPTQLTAVDAESLQDAVSADGSWIIIFEGDLSVDEDVTVFGAVYEEDGAEAPRRKLALYAQDEERNVTDRYTLTAPRLIVHHMNTRIQSGTVAGDVYVEAPGFELTRGGTIDGNLYFASEELQESATIDDDATVTGEIGIESVS